MIIEMTYGEWQIIRKLLILDGRPTYARTDKEYEVAAKLRERISDYAFDN